LEKGDTAYLVSALSRAFAGDLAGYEYSQERRYFSIREMRATVYGADPRTGLGKGLGAHNATTN
jgi:hypothetical protein